MVDSDDGTVWTIKVPLPHYVALTGQTSRNSSFNQKVAPRASGDDVR
jgi:hypothetical protein